MRLTPVLHHPFARRLRYLRALAALFALLTVGVGWGRAQSPSEPLCVQYTFLTDSDTPAQEIALGDPVVLDYLNRLDTPLSDRGLRVTFSRQCASAPLFLLVLALDDAGTLTDAAFYPPLQETPTTRALYALSPYLLTDHFQVMQGLEQTRLAAVSAIFYHTGDCPAALDALDALSRSADDLPPDDPLAPALARLIPPYVAFYRANCALLAGDNAAALALLASARAPRAGDPLADVLAVNEAWLLFQADEAARAFALLDGLWDDYRAAGEAFASIAQVLLLKRAQLHALNFEYDAAIADLQTLIGEYGDNPLYYVELGKALTLLYEWDAALTAYNRAIEIDPRYAPAYYWRALLYYTTLTDRQRALPDLALYLAFAPAGLYAEDAERYLNDIAQELDALSP